MIQQGCTLGAWMYEYLTAAHGRRMRVEKERRCSRVDCEVRRTQVGGRDTSWKTCEREGVIQRGGVCEREGVIQRDGVFSRGGQKVC